MASARVQDIDAIAGFRRTLQKFCETSVAALADAEGEVQRTMVWLQTEQRTFWQHQLRSRTEAVTRAKEALRWKKLYKDPTGARQSYIDEERALAVAQRRLLESEQKVQAIRRYTARLEKEMHSFKAAVQRFETSVTVDIPVAADLLAGVLEQLRRYVAAAPRVVGSEAGAAPVSAGASILSGGDESMARPDTAAADAEPPDPAAARDEGTRERPESEQPSPAGE